MEGKIERLITRIASKLPARPFGFNPNCPEKGPLAVRYFVIRTRWFGIYIHHILRSDSDRDTHDHPWSFFTFLLTGGYWEHALHKTVQVGCQDCFEKMPPEIHMEWIPRWSLKWRPATWRHRLELPGPVWTLVLRIKRHRQWGFWTVNGWVPFQKYESSAEDC